MSNWKTNFVSKSNNERFAARFSGSRLTSYYDPMFELNLIMIVIFIGFFAFIGVIVYRGHKTKEYCARWETKIEHQNAYTSWMYSGKTMIPIYHPARDYEKEVCVEVKQ